MAVEPGTNGPNVSARSPRPCAILDVNMMHKVSKLGAKS